MLTGHSCVEPSREHPEITPGLLSALEYSGPYCARLGIVLRHVRNHQEACVTETQ